MVARETTIYKAAVGLMPKPVSVMLMQKAYQFKSRIWIQKEENRADARSILDLLSLPLNDGDKISIIADGADEQEAVSFLAQLVETGCV